MKLKRALCATLLFIFLLGLIHYLHMRYFKVNVVLYAAMLDAVIAVIITSVSLRLPFFNPLGKFEKILLLIIYFLAGYSFAISIPTVIDRSLSFYILEKLQQRGGGIQEKNIQNVFIKEYLPEHRLVDVRLTEQLESGTIMIQHGCVKLTPKGERIASFSRFYRQHFLPKKRLLMGEYTDDLTNPFRHNTQPPDYLCK